MSHRKRSWKPSAISARLREHGKFRAWLFTILRRNCYRYLQQRHKEDVSLDDLAETLADPTPAAADMTITEFIDLLPLQYREILVARYLHDMSFREIAQAFHINELAARVRCTRARALLRKLIIQADEEERTLRKLMTGMTLVISSGFTGRVLQEVKMMLEVRATLSTPVAQQSLSHWHAWQTFTHLATVKTTMMMTGLLVILGGGALLLHHAGVRVPALRKTPVPQSGLSTSPHLSLPGLIRHLAPLPPPKPHPGGPLAKPSSEKLKPVIATPVCPSVATPKPAGNAAPPAPAPPREIAISPAPGFNLQIIGRPAKNVLMVRPNPPIHNWFAGKFTNLPVGQPVEIRIEMAGCDTGAGIADTKKWAGLRPVYTYADPEQYASYEWFRRDNHGRWVSGDFSKQGDARFAGRGDLPAQTAVPAQLAARCLSEDEQFWYPWGEIEGGKNNTRTRTFTFTVTPAAPMMTIALHVPYLLGYEREMIARLKAAHLPGVFVDELGQSAAGRPLYVIRVDDPDDPTPLQITPAGKPTIHLAHWGNQPLPMTDAHPIVRLATAPDRPWGEKRLMLLDAREHASEQPGSWVVLGALKALLADTPAAHRLREHTTWVLLPIFDPDGVATAEFDRCGETCVAMQKGDTPVSTPEALAYFSYLRAFVNAGWFYGAAATFYGLECNEGTPACCPFCPVEDMEKNIAFNRYWFKRLQAMGTLAGPEYPWDTGDEPSRLASGSAMKYHALGLFFEVNDRYPGNRLTLEGLESLGADYVQAIHAWATTPEGVRVMDAYRTAQRARLDKLEQLSFTDGRMPKDDPTVAEIINDGD